MLTLDQLNLRLKLDNIRVTVQARGMRLCLRATLPSKDGKGKQSQQRIPLNVNHTQAGLKKANLEARKLADELDRGVFDWSRWIDVNPDLPVSSLNCGEWVEGFRQHLFTHKLTGTEEEKTYKWKQQYFNRGIRQLPMEESLTPIIIRLIIQRTDPDMPSREKYVRALSALAKFAEVEVDLSDLKSKYGPKDTQPRNIPSDEEITRIIDAISDVRWRWAFGMMAAYGLRDHELFFSQVVIRDGAPVCDVNQGKTGARESYPVLRCWVDRWRLPENLTPKTTITVQAKLGMKVSKKWRLIAPNLEWTPYDLRHAYAIRCHIKRVPPATAAAWMGHSPTMHLNTYNKWISRQQHNDIWKNLED